MALPEKFNDKLRVRARASRVRMCGLACFSAGHKQARSAPLQRSRDLLSSVANRAARVTALEH